MQTKFKYPMNVVAKDTISGFQGVVIIRNAHLFGCSQYGLAPKELGSDGTPQQTQYFDESRIEIIDDSSAIAETFDYEKIFTIPLGAEVEDKVSGFDGKVLLAIEHLHNCNQYYVEPTVDKEKKPRDGHWYDEGRLVVKGKGISPEEVAAPKRGSIFSRDLPRVGR